MIIDSHYFFKLYINFELLFLKTPNRSKNIIVSDKNISGNIISKFSIISSQYFVLNLYYSYLSNWLQMFQLNLLMALDKIQKI